jgi:type IV pilus assembly protein PilW
MKQLSASRYRMHGLSLVELMVALTIGLIILTAVSSLFVSSKQTYTAQDNMARLQENARFAMQFLIKDLRLAGYFGCLYDVGVPPLKTFSDGSVGSSTLKYDLNGAIPFATNAFVPIEAVENASGTWLPSGTTPLPSGIKPGTDAIAIRMADLTVAANIAPGMLNGSSALNVDNAAPFTTGDIVMVADCGGADIIQITGINGNTLQHATTGASPGNVTLNLTKAYEPPGRVFRMTTRQYFIKTKANGVPALFRQDNTGAAEELVEGVENLQILYGKDTDGDRVPNVYLKAGAVGLQSATDWYSVVNARIGILVRTLDNKNQDVDNGSYDVDGDGTYEVTTPGDHYRRRVFQAVVQLRNVWAF